MLASFLGRRTDQAMEAAGNAVCTLQSSNLYCGNLKTDASYAAGSDGVAGWNPRILKSELLLCHSVNLRAEGIPDTPVFLLLPCI